MEELIDFNMADTSEVPLTSNFLFLDNSGYIINPEEFYFDFDEQGNSEPEISIDRKEVIGILPTETFGKLEVEFSTWFQCSTCQVLVDNSITLLEHERTHKNERRITKNLNRDIQSEVNETAVEIVLPLVLVSRIDESLLDVMNSTAFPSVAAIPNPDLTCSICNQRMSTKDSLRRHMMRHTGEKPYGCHICDYRAIQKTHLKAHIFYNHGESELKTVSLTPQIVPSVRKKLKKKEIERMQEKRFPFGPFRCERCNVGFRKNDNLQRHNSKRHNNEPDIPKSSATLGNSNITQPRKPRAQKARQLPNSNVNNAFHHLQVPQVPTSFPYNTDPVSLLAYVRCPVCSKLLSSENKLRKHIVTHVGVRPYSCSFCGKVFKQKYHLKRHVIRLHQPAGMPLSLPRVKYSAAAIFNSSMSPADKCHSQAAAPCPVCSRVLSNSDTLRRHMLIHQGIKPFSCQFCGETFRQKHHVQVHVRRHHRNESNTQTQQGSTGASGASTSGVQQQAHAPPTHVLPQPSQPVMMDAAAFGF